MSYTDESGLAVKQCNRCRLVLPVGLYGASRKGCRDGLRGMCKSCVREDSRRIYYADIEKQRARSRAKVASGSAKAAIRRHEMRRRYNLTPEQVDQMKADRGYACDICGKICNGPGRRMLHVDHCHTSGRVRGMLCHECNMAIGLLKDSAAVLAKAIAYLEKR